MKCGHQGIDLVRVSLSPGDIGEERDNVKANQDVAGLKREVPGNLNELARVR